MTHMSKNIDIKVNSVHAIWGLLVWKGPAYIGLFCLIVTIGSLAAGLVPYIAKNHEEQSTKMANFNELVRECERSQLEENGGYDSLMCKKWANTYYRVYSY